MECVDNNPVRAGAQLFSDGGQFLHAAKGSNPRCRFQPILAKAGEEPCIMPNHGFPLGVDIDLPDRIKEQKLPTNPAPCWSYTPTV